MFKPDDRDDLPNFEPKLKINDKNNKKKRRVFFEFKKIWKLNSNFILPSGTIKRQIHQAHANIFGCRSCQSATNVNTIQTFQCRVLEPPRGT